MKESIRPPIFSSFLFFETGSGGRREHRSGRAGGGAAGVSSPLQFDPTTTNPIAISFLQLGPNSAIPIPNWDPYRNIIPHWGPNINDWVPTIGSADSIGRSQLHRHNLNVVWLSWAIASIQLLQCNWLNASIPGAEQPGQLPSNGHVVIHYTAPTSSRR